MGKLGPKKSKLFVLPENWHRHKHTHIHTHTHAHAHTHMHTHIHTQTQTQTQTQTHTHTHTHTEYLEDADAYFVISFLNFNPKSRDDDSYSEISYAKFQT